MAKTPKKGRLKPREPDDYDVRGAGDDDEADVPAKAPSTPREAAEAEDAYFYGDDPKPAEKKAKPAEKKAKKAKAVDEKPSSPARRTVSMENRKLTKAQEAATSLWKHKGSVNTDLYFKRVVDSARRRTGHRKVLLGDETDKLVIAIPCYAGHGPDAAKYPGCLPFEFVIAQDGFPLGLILQLVARHGIGKSALLAEFGRWFFLCGGGLSLKESETKFNPKWYRSILGQRFFRAMPLYRCSSVEDWQRNLTDAIADNKAEMRGTKEKPGPGRTFPVLFGIDSIMGKQSEETQETILGKRDKRTGERGTTGRGHAARSYPIEAQVITKYMRTIPGELDEWPFSIVLVNHLRIRTDDMGNAERSKAGGEQVNFQESFELELKKVGGHKKKIETAGFEGVPLSLSCEKNSFGTTHRYVQTRLLWWDVEDEETGEWSQHTIWDWNWSTVWLIDNILNGEKSNPMLKQSLKDSGFHLKIESRGDSENAAWSETLGMTKADACSWSELGAMIRETPGVQDKLRKALHINRLPLLEGDYLKQLNELERNVP